jgi:hypothetical protein
LKYSSRGASKDRQDLRARRDPKVQQVPLALRDPKVTPAPQDLREQWAQQDRKARRDLKDHKEFRGYPDCNMSAELL